MSSTNTESSSRKRLMWGDVHVMMVEQVGLLAHGSVNTGSVEQDSFFSIWGYFYFSWNSNWAMFLVYRQIPDGIAAKLVHCFHATQHSATWGLEQF